MNTQTEIISQEQLEADILETIENHRDLVVIDDPGFIAAQEALKVVKGKLKQVEAWFKPQVKKAHELHKELKAKENSCTNPLKIVYNNIARICSGYQLKKEEEARKKRAEEEAQIRKQEEDGRLAEAAELEAQGRTEEAEAVIEEPINVAPPPLKTAPKVEGMSSRETWKFEIINANLVPRMYLMPDVVAIGGYVRAMKDRAQIPGVRVWVEKTQIVR